MDYVFKNTQKSSFPKQSTYKTVFYDKLGNYPIFSVQELYQDLFVNNKSGLALITFPKEPHKEKSGEALFCFLLPNEIVNKVVKSNQKKNN